MGRMLGAFDIDESNDRPDLNKCPDCGCFFASDNCTICGKLCPEEMRAGKRKPVKKKKNRGGGSSRTVMFIDWYHSRWFILLMLVMFPIAGIVLLITSPHKRSLKIGIAAVAVVYGIIQAYGLGGIVNRITGFFDKPVDTSLSEEEYLAACEIVDAETLYRDPEGYCDAFVSLTLTVSARLDDADGDGTYGNDTVYYLCTGATDNGDVEILLADHRVGSRQNFMIGDIVTVYGEGDGTCSVYDNTYMLRTASCINMAYAVISE